MNNKYIGMGVFAALGIGVLMLIFAIIGTVNSYSRLEVKAKAVQTDNTNVLDNTRKAIREAAQVSDAEVDALTKIIVGNSEARGSGPDGGQNNGISIGMVTEAVPGITSIETLKRLQNIIVAGRKEWQASQTRLIEVKRQADEQLAVFPGSMILGMMGKKEIEIVVVTSSETEDNFASGKDDRSWIETPNAEK